jgi:hypothetical protein
MNAYIARLLGDAGKPADEATVNALRLDYYLRYGVTMMGLVRHHGVQAEEFLQHAHTFHDLPSMIRSQRGLARCLRTLPGKNFADECTSALFPPGVNASESAPTIHAAYSGGGNACPWKIAA